MNAQLNAKVNQAYERIEKAYEIAEKAGNTLIVAYSGGKDSDVLLHLAIGCGVPFEAQHNHTTVDAPETVYHIREVFAGLPERGIAARVNMPQWIDDVDGRRVRATMWNLIPKNGLPPTRVARYCCRYFKERRYDNQHLLFGVRWDESTGRKSRGLHEALTSKKADRVIYQDENDDSRKLQEICHMRNRIATNPIIDWTHRDVWDYIHDNGIKTNPLYARGFDRVGCIGCPVARKNVRIREFKLYPAYERAYLRTFAKMLEVIKRKGVKTDAAWKDAEGVMQWWLDRDYNPDQLSIFERGNTQ
jgi:phosphoadenosine phosphosulfate reductase